MPLHRYFQPKMNIPSSRGKKYKKIKNNMYFFTHPTDTIGIDMSDHIIRMIFLQHRGRKKSIKKFGSIPLPEGAMRNSIIHDVQIVQRAIMTLCSQLHIHPKTVSTVVGLPESHGFIKSI